MTRADYYTDCLTESLDEHGITASAEQIAAVAKDIEGAAENVGMAFYQPENPAVSEVETLRKELALERAKITCRACNGRGRLEFTSGPWGINTVCDRCHGDGRYAP